MYANSYLNFYKSWISGHMCLIWDNTRIGHHVGHVSICSFYISLSGYLCTFKVGGHKYQLILS